LIGRAFTHSVTGVRLNELRFTEAAIPAIDARWIRSRGQKWSRRRVPGTSVIRESGKTDASQ
jgi:hypothetical protein